MIRVAPHFANVTRQRRHQIAYILHVQFDEQVSIRHRPPKLRFNHLTFKIGRQRLQRIQNQKVRADMGGMAVIFVRKKNHAWTVFGEVFRHDRHRRVPVGAILFTGFKTDPLQAPLAVQ